MIPINEESGRIARHEPGARLQGETVGALFSATGTFGDRHPSSWGGSSSGRVRMTEEHPGALNA
jgi:hypothetical protein